ncbi:hypothetical protein H9X95_12375 [Micromonospora chalcea]|uniref:hypothetical protein n=1 Tax=Micromonospora TaxID=1873 RepID=UPI00165760E8|nr:MULTISPECIES: hypothetical protein [Micromonospora]MBC8990946.1 hypothetical protein [Micromonospora chalcea]MBQ1069507.1 hypothetical protein [Micromonospora sp. D75]WDP97269.1 hypothetical protein PVK74_15135 [Micromonospora chalcea]
MTQFGLALDTAALLAYASGAKDVGARIAEAADYARDVLVPALCLAHANQQATAPQWELLELLAALPQVQITPVEPDMCAYLGGWSRRMTGRMDLAQLAMEAAANPLVPIVTDRRELLGEVLPKEWPIIDL